MTLFSPWHALALAYDLDEYVGNYKSLRVVVGNQIGLKQSNEIEIVNIRPERERDFCVGQENDDRVAVITVSFTQHLWLSI